MLPYVYRVTTYDPADRDERGAYTGTQDSASDHGPIEAAYLQAVAAFAEDTGVRQLSIREPQVAPALTHFGLEPATEGHGLPEEFPSGLAGFHDGADVPVPIALELVRAMLRDSGAWCRLEVEDTFAVHVGWDQYLYVGSSRPCEAALARTRAVGLFPERRKVSPYDIAHDGFDVQRPADADFWARLSWAVNAHRAAILEENPARNISRWHRLTPDTIAAVRSRLAPRALLTVWPAVRSALNSPCCAASSIWGEMCGGLLRAPNRMGGRSARGVWCRGHLPPQAGGGSQGGGSSSYWAYSGEPDNEARCGARRRGPSAHSVRSSKAATGGPVRADGKLRA